MLLDLTRMAIRWTHRRHTWRPLREPFDPSRFGVEPISHAAARTFVGTHHYSGSFPVALASYGLFERTGPHRTEIVGAAVFSLPIQPRAAASYGAGTTRFCDLGRFLLLDHVGGNAETWFLARAQRLLRLDGREQTQADLQQLVIAYSDPVPRQDCTGSVRFAGHFGGIYRDSAAIYLGRTKPRRIWLTPAGTVLSERALSKLRTDDRGADYAYETLQRHGAPPRRAGEIGGAYVARALSEGPFRALRHGGNHIYAFALGAPGSRRQLRRRLERDLPRPRHTDPLAGS